MEGLWWAKDKREMKPRLLRLGVALALSLAGYLYSHLRSRQTRRRSGSPSPRSLSGAEAEFDGRMAAGGGLKDELQLMKQEEVSPKIINSTAAAVALLSPDSRDLGDEELDLLPELNELVHKEFESSESGQDTLTIRTPRKSEIKDGAATEKEIANLKNIVCSLRDRERILEMQLLEYYGLKEQESAVRELENRLKISTMETKLFSMKIESLQADNQRLEAQVSEYGRIKAEFESAKGKIKLLKRKLQSESEQAKEIVTSLQQSVAALKDWNYTNAEDSENVERNLKRMKDLEDEALDLRRVNSRLALEKLDLEKKLESTQILASRVLEGPEAAKALEEAQSLRQTNEHLTKEIEQLQMDRCVDVEELVYLRWVNACLRYELRNYQPPPGKTIARDLSKSLSPKSEEEAKQLILEYANLGIDEQNINLADFSLECFSPSQTSSLTETGEDDTSVDTPDTPTAKTSSSRKTKFLSKLKRLVLGKESQINRGPSFENSGRRGFVSIGSLDEVMERDSYDRTASWIPLDCQNKASRTQSLSRDSLGLQTVRSRSSEVLQRGEERSRSDIGTTYRQKKMTFGEESLIGSPHPGQFDHLNVDSPEKMELNKFANVLKSSRSRLMPNQRSVSFDLY